tara:strand:- start:1420 stop:1923 length:504 start_codon:yes stop_codon:yes gene_type:complete
LIARKKLNTRYRLLWILFTLTFSCNSNLEFIDYNSLDGSWHKDSIQEFSFELIGAESDSFNSYINLRLNDNYIFNNIFMIVKLRDTSQTISIDTLQFRIADKSGNFLGKKGINIIDYSLPHKENLNFDSNKKYIVSVEHAMRVINKTDGLQKLDGIEDVGFKILKIN